MILIDAYNLLHQWRGNRAGDAPGDDLRALAALIRRGPWGGGRVRMVCDGSPPENGGPETPGVEVVYAGAGQSADEVLIDTVNRSSGASGLTVVSSDRMIAAAARKRGATAVESGAFLARLVASVASASHPRFQPKPLPSLPLGDAEVGFWLGFFGERLDIVPREGRGASPSPASPPKRRADREATRGSKAASECGFSRATTAESGERWFEDARRMWPDLTVEDLRMDRWLDGEGGACR